MKPQSQTDHFGRSVATAEELIYEAVNAFCHGNIQTSRDIITQAIDTIEHIHIPPSELSETDLDALENVTTRAYLVLSDIKEQADLFQHSCAL